MWKKTHHPIPTQAPNSQHTPFNTIQKTSSPTGKHTATKHTQTHGNTKTQSTQFSRIHTAQAHIHTSDTRGKYLSQTPHHIKDISQYTLPSMHLPTMHHRSTPPNKSTHTKRTKQHTKQSSCERIPNTTHTETHFQQKAHDADPETQNPLKSWTHMKQIKLRAPWQKAPHRTNPHTKHN